MLVSGALKGTKVVCSNRVEVEEPEIMAIRNTGNCTYDQPSAILVPPVAPPAANKFVNKRKVSWDVVQKEPVNENPPSPSEVVAKHRPSQKSHKAGSPDIASKRCRKWPPMLLASPVHHQVPTVPLPPPLPLAPHADCTGRDRAEGGRPLSPLRGGRIDPCGAEDNFGFEDYMDNIYEWNHTLEMKHHVKNFLAKQPLVDEGNRAAMVNWLAKVNRSFEYYYETYFLTVSIMDRFLATTPISLECLHLLAITAFMLASKVVECGHPRVNELLKLSAGAYSRQHVLQMEKIILSKLKFSISVPTAVVFLEYYLYERRSTLRNPAVRDLRESGYRLLELCILRYDLCQYRASVLAMAALIVAEELVKGSRWQIGADTAKVLGLNLAEVRECAARVRMVLAEADTLLPEPHVNWRVAR